MYKKTYTIYVNQRMDLNILKYLHGGYKAEEGGNVTYNIKQHKSY